MMLSGDVNHDHQIDDDDNYMEYLMYKLGEMKNKVFRHT
jgi:hypothetical protein